MRPILDCVDVDVRYVIIRGVLRAGEHDAGHDNEGLVVVASHPVIIHVLPHLRF